MKKNYVLKRLCFLMVIGIASMLNVHAKTTNFDGVDSPMSNTIIMSQTGFSSDVDTLAVAPVASFSMSDSVISVGDTIWFTDNSYNNPTYRNWNFDGGNPQYSTEESTFVWYNQPGIYYVMLYVSNSAGSDSTLKTINVVPEDSVMTPVASFSMSASVISVGDTIWFTDNSYNNPSSRNWHFEGGSPEYSSEKHPMVQYNQPGIYYVMLYVSNSAGYDSTLKTIKVVAQDSVMAPVAEFFLSDTIISVGDSIWFIDTSYNSPTYRSWHFEGGSPEYSSEKYPMVQYNQPGIFYVMLYVSNSAGYDSTLMTIKVVAQDSVMAPVAAFFLSDTIISVGDSIWFIDTSYNSPTYRSWYFEGGNPENSTEENLITWYNQPGIYTVTLFVSNSAGFDTLVKTIQVEGSDTIVPPVAVFSLSDSIISVGDSIWFVDESVNNPIDWYWNFDGGNPEYSYKQNPTIWYDQTGIYTVMLRVWNTAGYDSTFKTIKVVAQDSVMAPVASFSLSDSIISVGDSIWFLDNSYNDPSSRNWHFEGGNPENSSEKHPMVQYNQSGIYSVMLYVSNSAGSDSSLKTINVVPEDSVMTPVASFSMSASVISVGDTIWFTDNSYNNPSSRNWHFEGGSPEYSSEKHPMVQYNQPGIYYVMLYVSNSEGYDSTSKTIEVVAKDTVVGYCSTKGNNYNYEWISNVQVANFSNSSSAASYTDFTSKTISLSTFDTVSVRLTPGFRSRSYLEYWKIWIDYNVDGDFDDFGEEVFSGSGRAEVSGFFHVSDIPTTTRMRITMKYNGVPTPCETFTYGEVEDYTVNISRSISMRSKAASGMEEQAESKFLVYPNIVSENLQISTDDVDAELKVVNMVGSIVKSQAINGNYHVINVSDLPKGLYYIYLDNKGKVSASKFIKQ